MAALPPTINTGIVTGLFGDIQTTETGPFTQFLTGSASFQASPNYFVDSGAKKIYVPKPFSVDLVNGAFSVVVLACDEEDFMPVSWTWKVTFTIPGLNLGPFNIKVLTGTTTDISSLSTPGGPSSTGIVVTKGVKGEPGADSTVPGPPGAASTVPGPPGDPGKSAYQVALDVGFVGDAAAWLESLRGPRGFAGQDSTVPGPPGPTSTTPGPPGTPGSVVGLLWVPNLEAVPNGTAADTLVILRPA